MHRLNTTSEGEMLVDEADSKSPEASTVMLWMHYVLHLPTIRKCVLTNRSEPRDEINTQAAGGSEPPDRLPA